MKNTFEFTANTLTVNGSAFAARYAIDRGGRTRPARVIIWATVAEGNEQKIEVPEADEYFPAALAAADAAEEAPQAAASEVPASAEEAPQAAEEAPAVTEEAPQAAEEAPAVTEEAPAVTEEAPAVTEEAPAVTEEAPQAAEEAPASAEEAPAVTDPKAAHGPVPEKTFVGSAIAGRGWTIVFDGRTERTRVFLTDNSPALRAAVEAAGFIWAPSMRSYNRRLTWRAYRAAVALGEELDRLTATAAA